MKKIDQTRLMNSWNSWSRLVGESNKDTKIKKELNPVDNKTLANYVPYVIQNWTNWGHDQNSNLFPIKL